eukprot:Filipodium_phascolosomae@DN365_c0_g1_i1.p1
MSDNELLFKRVQETDGDPIARLLVIIYSMSSCGEISAEQKAYLKSLVLCQDESMIDVGSIPVMTLKELTSIRKTLKALSFSGASGDAAPSRIATASNEVQAGNQPEEELLDEDVRCNAGSGAPAEGPSPFTTAWRSANKNKHRQQATSEKGSSVNGSSNQNQWLTVYPQQKQMNSAGAASGFGPVPAQGGRGTTTGTSRHLAAGPYQTTTFDQQQNLQQHRPSILSHSMGGVPPGSAADLMATAMWYFAAANAAGVGTPTLPRPPLSTGSIIGGQGVRPGEKMAATAVEGGFEGQGGSEQYSQQGETNWYGPYAEPYADSGVAGAGNFGGAAPSAVQNEVYSSAMYSTATAGMGNVSEPSRSVSVSDQPIAWGGRGQQESDMVALQLQTQQLQKQLQMLQLQQQMSTQATFQPPASDRGNIESGAAPWIRERNRMAGDEDSNTARVVESGGAASWHGHRERPAAKDPPQYKNANKSHAPPMSPTSPLGAALCNRKRAHLKNQQQHQSQ